jgi:hypothetical protein
VPVKKTAPVNKPVAKAAAARTAAAPAPVKTPERPPAPEGRRLSASRVREIWSKTDTRSLDRALSSLRSATLAFRRCEMRVTGDDRAVTRCDEIGPDATPVAWIIDFRRDDGRWLIDGLASGRQQSN